MLSKARLDIELVHLQAGLCQFLTLEEGSTIGDALKVAGLVLGSENTVGIFGEIKALSYVLYSGDRIEIYSPLHFDPKLRRLHKVEKTTLPRRCK